MFFYFSLPVGDYKVVKLYVYQSLRNPVTFRQAVQLLANQLIPFFGRHPALLAYLQYSTKKKKTIRNGISDIIINKRKRNTKGFFARVIIVSHLVLFGYFAYWAGEDLSTRYPWKLVVHLCSKMHVVESFHQFGEDFLIPMYEDYMSAVSLCLLF